MSYLVEGRSTSMLFGSTFPDAPPIFLTAQDLANTWGKGDRKILFVPIEKRDEVDRLLGNNKLLLKESSGKALYTDRPLNNPVLSLNDPFSVNSDHRTEGQSTTINNEQQATTTAN